MRPYYFVLLLAAAGCGVPQLSEPEVYTADWPGMVAFMEDHCTECHNSEGEASTVYPNAIAADVLLARRVFVVPGEPDASKLWRTVSGDLDVADFADMPLNGLLDPLQTDHVRAWIAAGATVPDPPDADGDGSPDWVSDCDDNDPSIYPGAPEFCDGIDNDCSGVVDDPPGGTFADSDGDGAGDPLLPLGGCDPAGVPDNNDCDDGDDDRFPGADELCNGVDDDCDGVVDPASSLDAVLWHPDLDGDGHGDSSGEQLPSVVSCEAPAGYVVLSGDCDDGRAFVYPGAGEVCNGLDDDCDGAVDDAATGLRDWYVDGDTDGFGTGVPLSACLAPSGRVAADGDCDDTDDRYHPSAPEPICQQPFDFNCDGFTGTGDADGDGFSACEECDDGAAGTNPSAPEVCDNVDNDCDGAIDEEPSNGQTYFQDQDGDGQGSAAVESCGPALGLSLLDSDCDDSNAAVFTGANEQCNGIDDNCDGQVDESGVGTQTLYEDADGDGYGNPMVTEKGCGASNGYVLLAGDCDDGDASIHPGSVDVADGIDNDCDGLLDEDVLPTPDYSADIQPIWDARCTTACHGGTVAAGGLRLNGDSHAELVAVSSSGLPSMHLVSPGDPANSYLWHKLMGSHQSVGGTGSVMPKNGGPLTQGQLDVIESWILANAP